MDYSRPLHAALTVDERYRLLLESVTDYAIYMLDDVGTVSSWNPGARRIKGYEEAEILGENFSRFYTDEDRASGLPRRALDTAAREGKFEGEGWRVRKDGSRFWAHVVIDPIRDASGGLIGYAKITRDLTEQRRNADILKQSEDQFRLLVQGVTDYALYMLDPAGRVASWNQGAERIKGYRPEEIIGQHFSRFHTEDDQRNGEPEKSLAVALRDGRFEKEGWRVRKDGTRLWAGVVIDVIRDPHGELIGFAKITRDLTERRDAQQALEQAREALFQSQKMDALGQLTGGVAHDFNNLLMVILGSLEMARKRLPDDARLKLFIDNAIQGAQRGSTLTHRMLAFARRQDLKTEAVDVLALVRGMTDLLQRSLGPSTRIETHFPLTIPPVQADANQLEMALMNLVVNARDAMPNGGPIVLGAREETISQGQEHALPAGRYICISVTDRGEGMDAETLARAAEPFFTTKGTGKGTGLGLSMVHGMAEQSGGRFVLKSREGEGTSAELWLPAATVADAPAVAPVRASEADDRVRPLVVLAVDDDNLVLLNTAAMLEDMGHTVLEANSGLAALEILRREGPADLVIVDYAMPHMTGVQLAERIRSDAPELPIILATGYAELPPGAQSDLPRLAKPFRQEDLVRAILQAVQPPG